LVLLCKYYIYVCLREGEQREERGEKRGER